MQRIGVLSKVWTGVAILVICTSINARAGSNLSGLTVSANWDYPTLGTLYEGSTPSSGVVGPSDLLFVFGPFNTAMDINVSASMNTITLLGQNNGNDGSHYDNTAFNGFVISLLHPPAGFAFTGVQIQSINWDNQTPLISFNADDIYINMAGMTQIGPGSDIVLSYTTTPIPEPGSLAILAGSGMVGLCLIRRRIGRLQRPSHRI
ncbi:MAG: PEP-CTERM sorting domain-containing protein [Candidatus Korobacteraceae bacterium]